MSTDVRASAVEAVAERLLQPALHDLVLVLRAPTVVASGHDGQLRGTGAQGVLHADLRALSTAVLTVNGEEPEPVSHARTGPDTARFTGLLRRLGDDGPDPTVRVDRTRTVAPGRVAGAGRPRLDRRRPGAGAGRARGWPRTTSRWTR